MAIVAGENEACVDKALKMLKVEYEVLPAVLDFHTAKDNEVLVHPEDNWKALCQVAQIISGTYVHVTALKTGM